MQQTRTTGAIRASWAYDTATRVGGGTAKGQVASSTRFAGGKQYKTSYPTYDNAYRPAQIDVTLPTDASLRGLSGKTLSTKYQYTADGQLEQTSYPQISDGATRVLGAETVTTRFDDASMPSWMGGSFGWGVYVADSRWTADGKPLLQDLGNTYGAAVTYDWDPATQRLDRLMLDRERIDGTEVDLAFDYDAAGNITSMIDAPTNTAVAGSRDAQCYAYDGLQRLQVAWTSQSAACGDATLGSGIGGLAPYWTEYTYDVLGNRTKMVEHEGPNARTVTYRHGQNGAGPHQLTSVTEDTGDLEITTGFTWDAAGNQTSRTANNELQTQTWDAEGELTSITGAGEDIANVFDADGGRLLRNDASGTTIFLPSGQEILVTSSKVTAKRWYAFGGGVVAMRDSNGLGGVSTIVTDHNGTAIAYVHNTKWQEGVQRIRTDAFGAARTGESDQVAGHGFLGAPSDSTGLTMLGARFYDRDTGTFLSVDPILDPGLPAQFNAYVYAGNNPMTWSDPSGLNWIEDTVNAVVNGFKAAADWTREYAPEIGGAVVGGVTGAACVAATVGLGSVFCVAGGGAVGGLTTSGLHQVRDGEFRPLDLLINTAAGAGGGALLHGGGKALGWMFKKAKGPKSATVTKSAAAAPRVPIGGSTAAPQRFGVAGQGGWRKPVPTRSGGGSKPSTKTQTAQRGNPCATNSFVPGTAVVLADGSTRAIELVSIDDEVLAIDPATGEAVARPVVAAITGTGEKDLIEVTVSLSDEKSASVTATEGHPFWVADLAEWVPAGDLQAGMWLQTSAGTWVQISAVNHDHREQAVHNLTVAGSHTYYVESGGGAVLTHNCGDADISAANFAQKTFRETFSGSSHLSV